MLSNTAIRLLVGSFGVDTHTIEIKPGTPGLNELVESKLISRHPGILGSHSSYYRTDAGIAAWQTMAVNARG